MTTPNNTVAGLAAKMDMHDPALIIRYGVDYLDGWNSAVEAMQAALASPAPSAGVEDLLRRIDGAIERVTSGRGQMRIPAEDTDPDLVLADAANWIKARALQHPAAPSKPFVGVVCPECDAEFVASAAPSAPPSVAGDAGELPVDDELIALADEMQRQHDDGRAPWIHPMDISRVRKAAIRRLATAEQPGSAVQGEK